MKASKFQNSLVGARVRLKDGMVGSVGSQDSNNPAWYGLWVKGKERKILTSEVAEVGDDVKFRTTELAKEFGFVFVSMKSLCSK